MIGMGKGEAKRMEEEKKAIYSRSLQEGSWNV